MNSLQTKTTFRLTFSLLLLAVGLVTFTHRAQVVKAQSLVEQVLEKSTKKNEKTTAKNTDTLEETAGKSIEQVKKYLDPSRVQGVLKEMFTNHHGIVGEVQRINEDALTIKNTHGTTILALSSPEISITKDNEKIEIKDIAVGNWVTLLGYKEAEDFTPKAVVVSADSPRPKSQLVMLGMITNISTKDVTVQDRGTSEERTFAFTRSSTVEDAKGEEARIADLDQDLTVLVVATSTDDSEEYEVVTLRSLAALDALN